MAAEESAAAAAQFEIVLTRCRYLPVNEIFGRNERNECRLCDIFVKDRKHLKSQNHRRRLICIRLFVLWDEIQKKPEIEQLEPIMEQINWCLMQKIEDSSDSAFLLWMYSKSWSYKYTVGSQETRQQGLYDGSKVWFENFQKNLRVLIRSVRETPDCAALAEKINQIESILNALFRKDNHTDQDDLAQVRHFLTCVGPNFQVTTENLLV
jgi:hypothetical protein